MGIFQKLNPAEIVKDAFSLIDQAVVDKDAKLKLTFAVMELQQQMRLAELATTTVPWVDAVHKLGRQIISVVSIAAVVVLKLNGYEISMEELLALSGAGVAYNIVKGKGK